MSEDIGNNQGNISKNVIDQARNVGEPAREWLKNAQLENSERSGMQISTGGAGSLESEEIDNKRTENAKEYAAMNPDQKVSRIRREYDGIKDFHNQHMIDRKLKSSINNEVLAGAVKDLLTLPLEILKDMFILFSNEGANNEWKLVIETVQVAIDAVAMPFNRSIQKAQEFQRAYGGEELLAVLDEQAKNQNKGSKTSQQLLTPSTKVRNVTRELAVADPGYTGDIDFNDNDGQAIGGGAGSLGHSPER